MNIAISATTGDRIPSAIIQLGLWLVPETGGTYKSVQQFQTVLNSRVFSFTFRESLERLSPKERQESYAIHLPIKDTFFGRRYCLVAEEEYKSLEAMVASSRLLICHCLWRWGAVVSHRLSRRHGIPLWVVPHGSLDPYVWGYNSVIKHLWHQFYGRAILRDADAVICATQREKEKVLQVAPDSRCVVLNWPVKVPSPVAARKRRQTRETLGLPDDHRVLLYFGRLHPMKRLLELVQVFDSRKHEKCALLIVGPGNDRYAHEVRKRAHAAKNSRIIVHGPLYREEKDALLGAADGYISYSARENFGLAAAEALAAGLPAILSVGNDLSYDIRAVGCGWCLTEDSVAELDAAIADFETADLGRLQRMGRAARTWVAEFLSTERFAAQLITLADQAINP